MLNAAADRQADFERRIADGKLVPIGGNQYRVNEPGNWDNGEVWTLQNGSILPQHGLDMTTGQAALYSTVPAWHSLGNVVPGGTSDVDEVLKLGGIDFDVEKVPVFYRAKHDAPDKILPERYVTVRSDNGEGLGVVGSRYHVLQNRQVFEFLQDLVHDYGVTWESAGALRDGRKVFVSMRLPETVSIDAEGVNDEIIPFIVAVNSHDGSSLAQVVVTPWRPVCGNTERFAVRDAVTRWGVRHTRNATDRISEARRTLGLSVKYFEHFKAEEESLARTDITLTEWDHVIADLWPKPEDDSRRAWTIHENRKSELSSLFRSNAARLGRTAYAAERAITEYADWKTSVRPGAGLRGNNLAVRATAVMEGNNDDIKSTAHKRLLTMVRR
jgi:phage/plasmid-like protein (TIGR03299 family)